MPDENQSTPADAGAEEDKKTGKTTDKTEDDSQKGEKGENPADDKKGKKSEKTVTISEKEHNRLQAIARKNEKKGEKSKKFSSKKQPGFSYEEPEENEPDEDDIRNQDREEYAKVRSGVVDLLFDNDDYKEVFKVEPTLRKILKNDPLALLDETPIDAEDALEKIQEYLDSRVEEIKKAKDDKDDKDDKGSSGEKDKKTSPKPAPQKPKTEKKEDKKTTSASTMQEVEGGLMDKVKTAQETGKGD